MAIELRYGKFGPYFHDGEDLGLGEVLIRLGDGEHLRREVEAAVEKLEYEVAARWDSQEELNQCIDQLQKALAHQTELVPPSSKPGA